MGGRFSSCSQFHSVAVEHSGEGVLLRDTGTGSRSSHAVAQEEAEKAGTSVDNHEKPTFSVCRYHKIVAQLRHKHSKPELMEDILHSAQQEK